MTDKIQLLKELCLAFGPSGCEGNVAEMILKKAEPFGFAHTLDRMGNLVFHIPVKNGEKAERWMLSAHMDEVGFMIRDITEGGFLKFSCVGGIDERVLCGRNVTVGDEAERIAGVIASKAIHHQSAEERAKTTPVKEMYIDIGATSREDAQAQVEIGDFGTFDSEFVIFGEDKSFVKSKALDDRMGCAVLLLLMENIASGKIVPTKELYICFTVREEVGLSGAQTVAQRLEPDRAIVLETTAVADIADVKPNSRVADLGKGGALSLADRSTIYSREFIDLALETAKKNGVPVQVKRYISGGNDAGHIHKSGKGVKCLALSAPTRYLHSAACVASLADYESVQRLVEALVKE